MKFFIYHIYMKQDSAVATYDFTLKSLDIPHSAVIYELKELAKKWCFQLELGDTGYEHYQGRLSLKVKKRLGEICSRLKSCEVLNKAHLSVTSNENRDNCFYVTKEDTRIAGPWMDKDEELYIPRQIRGITELRPWQEFIKQDILKFDTRTINILICVTGNIGKSTLLTYLHCHKLARRLPPINDAKDLMRIVCDAPTSTAYLIDLPRAMNKERLHGLYAGIESIKDGFAYDDRYKYREKIFDCPSIWVFTNTEPDITLLSRDRWAFWSVKNNHIVSV